MAEFISFFQNHTPLLERYALSSNPSAFLESLPAQDKKLMTLLLDPSSQNDAQTAKQLGLSTAAKKDLQTSKTIRSLRESTTDLEKQTLLKKLLENMTDLVFDFPQPVELNPSANTVQSTTNNEKKPSNRLITQETVEAVTLKAIEQNPNNFAKLSPYGLKNFPLQRLTKMDDHLIGSLFSKPDVIRSLDPQSLSEVLSHFITKATQNKHSSEQQEFPREFFDMLTLEQIDALKNKLPKLFTSYAYYRESFRLSHEESLSKYKPIAELSFEEKQNKKKLCLDILTDIKKQNNDFGFFFIEKLTEEVLLIEAALVDSDLTRFVEYLTNLKTINYENLDHKYREQIRQHYGKNKFYNQAQQPLSYLDSAKISQDELINRTIISLFKKDYPNLVDSLAPFISRKYLLKQQAKIELARGHQNKLNNLHEIFTVSQLTQIKEKKLLTLAASNKRTYRSNQSVELQLTAKNAKDITVKIYNIDLEKHYLENKSEPNQQINLKFLVPSTPSRIINTKSDDPFFQELVTVPLPELDKELGLFIVDLQGEGISSRAVIRKGTIVVKNTPTAIGHKLTFYDEEGILIPQLGLWRDGKKITVDGSYTIPFGSQGRQEIIPVLNKYAQLDYVDIISENYSLSVDYLFHSQSFVVGQKSKVVLRADLTLAGQRVSLNRISKSTLKVTTINNQSISSSVTIDNPKLLDTEEYVLELPIKSYLRTISIQLELQIQRIDKTKQTINSQKTVNINLEEQHSNFVDLYLNRDVEGQYTLKAKGKNGQAIPYVSSVFSYEQFGADFSFNQTLTADEAGSFELGTLPQVRKLTASVTNNGYSSSRTWRLNQFSDSVSYGGPIFSNSFRLFLKQGDSFVVPLPHPMESQDLVFYRTNPSTNATSNYLPHLKNTPNRLIAEKLTPGRYTLILLRLERRIDLQVVRGRKWIDNSIIDQNNTIYKVNKSTDSFLALGDLAIEKKGQHFEYSIDILGVGETLPSDLRVHVFGKNYLDSQNTQIYNSQNCVKCIPNQHEQLIIKPSNYYSDKTLSDQTAYVLNRRKQEKTAGNNLEKPHMFLKRTEVRSTDTKDEVLRAESKFESMSYEPHMMSMKCAAPRMMMDKCLRMDDMYGAYNLGTGYSGGQFYGQQQSISLQRGLNTHNNFLAKVGHLFPNLLKPLSIKLPQGYSHLIVHLYTEKVSVRREYSIPNSTKTEAINLTHPRLQDKSADEGWTMSREIYPLLPGEERTINRNCTWTTVSLANIIEYARTQGHTLPQWLSNWHLYSEAKQLQTYDKDFSHQLNFFLYKNDRKFFEKVAKPFLKHRLRKSFIDHYLLDSPETLEYASPHRLEKLNHFERALLVEALRKSGKNAEAQSLAIAMELPLKNSKVSNQTFKIFFETVLNAKKTGTVPPAYPPPGQVNLSLFGAPPPPGRVFLQSAPVYRNYSSDDECDIQNECLMGQAQIYSAEMSYNPYQQQVMRQQAKQQYKTGFKETQKTRQYADTFYEGVTDPSQTSTLIGPSLFWAELGKYNSTNSKSHFLSDKFSTFSNRREFIFACSVLPSSHQADFQLANSEGNYLVSAKSPFLAFVRQVKALPFKETGSIVLNQRFFDPKSKYYYDQDGTQCQKTVTNFLHLKPYTLQTIITNISGSSLEIQLLIDIPEGSIPLKNHEQTQILNLNLSAYTTSTIQRQFYFPHPGNFQLYPANASKNKTIIAKASQKQPLTVTDSQTASTKESLDNILRSGSNEEVYQFLRTKNIFDANQFDFRLILWKLKDKNFFLSVLSIFKQRNYFNPIVWSFALHHQLPEASLQFLQSRNKTSLGCPELNLPIFEYFPYFSSRVHKFADQNKSTIRVKQFKQTYAQFLISAAFQHRINDPTTRIALIYYLLLQDRTAQATELRQYATKEENSLFQLQYDYIDCFLDMTGGASNQYATASKIANNYKDYPVAAWRKLFNDVNEALSKSKEQETEESSKSQDTSFSTTVVNNGTDIKINRPALTKVTVNFYKIDLQLYFSQFPFSEVSNFSAVAPSKSLEFNGPNFQVHSLQKQDFQELGDTVIQIYEHRQNSAAVQISRFLWNNPLVKVKINEKQGTLKVFFDKKKCKTSYCKVYSRGSKGEKFYRDGYTDVASTFRYALDINDISEFSILVLTEHGGSIHKVKPPIVQ